MWQCDLWPLSPDCLPDGWYVDPAAWTGHQRRAVEAATAILRRLSAGQYGLCTVKIRPCRSACLDRLYGPAAYPMGVVTGPWTPMLIDGRAYNITCGCPSGGCGCGPLSEITLNPPATEDPAATVVVKVDGLTLPTSAYRIDGHRKLVRLDSKSWPNCQDLDKPDTATGTFSVTYKTGTPLDESGKIAVTVLASEIYRACTGAKNCALSDRVTSVVREGITYTLDNLTVFESGRTGLPRVDMWLATVNPYSARAPMKVWSPDTSQHRRTTWTAS